MKCCENQDADRELQNHRKTFNSSVFHLINEKLIFLNYENITGNKKDID